MSLRWIDVSISAYLSSVPSNSVVLRLTLAATHTVPSTFNSTFGADIASNLGRILGLGGSSSDSVADYLQVVSVEGCLTDNSHTAAFSSSSSSSGSGSHSRRLLQSSVTARNEPLIANTVILGSIDSILPNGTLAALTANTTNQTSPLTQSIAYKLGEMLVAAVTNGTFQANRSNIAVQGAEVSAVSVDSSSSSSSSSASARSASSSSSVPLQHEPDNTDARGASSDLSRGAVAGVVLGVCAAVGLIVLMAVWLLRLRRTSGSDKAGKGEVAHAEEGAEGADGVGKGQWSSTQWRSAAPPAVISWTGVNFS